MPGSRSSVLAKAGLAAVTFSSSSKTERDIPNSCRKVVACHDSASPRVSSAHSYSSLFQSACRLEWRHSPHPRGSRQTLPAADPQRENRGFPLFLPSLRPGAVSTGQDASVRSRASISSRRRLRRRRASSSRSSSDEEVLSPLLLLLLEPPAVSLLPQSLILPLWSDVPRKKKTCEVCRTWESNLGPQTDPPKLVKTPPRLGFPPRFSQN